MPSDFTALVRYALPGSIFFLVLALPHALSLVVPVGVRSTAFGPFQAPAASALSALLIGAVIAVGYILYQVYFYFYWVLAEYGIGGERQSIPKDTAQGTSIADKVANADSFHEKWFIVEGRWFELLGLRTTGKDGVQLIAARASRLFDTYHSLGAILAAVFLGAIVHVVAVTAWDVTGQCWVLIPLLVILWGVIHVLQQNRKYTRHSIVRYQNAMLRALEAAPFEGNKANGCPPAERGDKGAPPDQSANKRELGSGS